MPYALVLHCLSANGPLRPDDLQGQKGLALFLDNLIRNQDPSVSARLHAHKNDKPFTTALITQPGTARETTRRHGTPNDSAGSAEVKLRLTLLDDTLYPLVSQFFLQHLNGIPALRLGQTSLTVARVMGSPESDEPWAGFARFEDILAAASPVEKAWHIRFATPTSFKAGNADLPLPIPRLCFQSWLNSWDEHAPTPFFEDKAERRDFLSKVVEGNVSVTYSEVRLVKRMLFFNGVRTREQGFVGACRFAVRPTKVAPEHRKLLDALTRYSYYAGTGRKTTMGMGMTRRLEKE